MMRKLLLVLMLCVSIIFGMCGCGLVGNKYITIRVTSDPPGASVSYLVKLKGTEYIEAQLGETPTRQIGLKFNSMVQGDGQHGVRFELSGYETKDVFIDHKEWHDSKKKANENVRGVFVFLDPLEE
jgi:hypothetical protein